MALRAFVAMAFGRQDTDRLYDEAIVPVLRGRGITAVRVDRIEHNDDIDKRIIAELRGCDLALADLTYARPSVYFEAGYAQRVTPVIFTARKDHLQPRADDEFGNFKVHFDLQMRNIIDWEPTPSALDHFRRRLLRRLDHVCRPIEARLHEGDVSKKEAERYGALSQEHRLALAVAVARRTVEAAGFRAIATTDPESPAYGHEGWVSSRGTRLGFIGVMAAASLPKGEWEFLATRVLVPFLDFNTPLNGPHLSEIAELDLAISLRSVPLSRIEDVLPQFHHSSTGTEHLWEGTLEVPRGRPFGSAPICYAGLHTLWVGSRPEQGRVAPTLLDVRDGRAWTRVQGARLHGGGADTRAVCWTKRVPRRMTIAVLDRFSSEQQLAVQIGEVLGRWRMGRPALK